MTRGLWVRAAHGMLVNLQQAQAIRVRPRQASTDMRPGSEPQYLLSVIFAEHEEVPLAAGNEKRCRDAFEYLASLLSLDTVVVPW